MRLTKSLILTLSSAITLLTLSACSQMQDEPVKPTPPAFTVSNFESTAWSGKFGEYEIETLLDSNQVVTVGIFAEAKSCITAVGKYSVNGSSLDFEQLRISDQAGSPQRNYKCFLFIQTFHKVKVNDLQHLALEVALDRGGATEVILTPIVRTASRLLAPPVPVETPEPSPLPLPPTPAPIHNTIVIDPEYVTCFGDVTPLALSSKAFSGYWSFIYASKAESLARSTDKVKCEAVRLEAKSLQRMVVIDLTLGYEYDKRMLNPWNDDRFFKVEGSQPCVGGGQQTVSEPKETVTIYPDHFREIRCSDDHNSASISINLGSGYDSIFEFGDNQPMQNSGTDYVKCWSIVELATKLNKPIAIDLAFARQALRDGKNPWRNDAFIRVLGLPACQAN